MEDDMQVSDGSAMAGRRHSQQPASSGAISSVSLTHRYAATTLSRQQRPSSITNWDSHRPL